MSKTSAVEEPGVSPEIRRWNDPRSTKSLSGSGDNFFGPSVRPQIVDRLKPLVLQDFLGLTAAIAASTVEDDRIVAIAELVDALFDFPKWDGGCPLEAIVVVFLSGAHVDQSRVTGGEKYFGFVDILFVRAADEAEAGGDEKAKEGDDGDDGGDVKQGVHDELWGEELLIVAGSQIPCRHDLEGVTARGKRSFLRSCLHTGRWPRWPGGSELSHAWLWRRRYIRSLRILATTASTKSPKAIAGKYGT